jgi:hypothetical protein
MDLGMSMKQSIVDVKHMQTAGMLSLPRFFDVGEKCFHFYL